jgi:hypothetical protein
MLASGNDGVAAWRDTHHSVARRKRLSLIHEINSPPGTILTGNIAMDTVPASKSPAANWREGVVLTAMQLMPAFSASALVLKLLGNKQILGQPGGAAIFVLLACITVAIITARLGPRFPDRVKNYEPLFFDPTLYVEQKVQGWLDKPGTAKQLLKTAFVLALLAIAVVSVP